METTLFMEKQKVKKLIPLMMMALIHYIVRLWWMQEVS